MRRIHRSWFALVIVLCSVTLTPYAEAQPKKKPAAATKADIERLEKRIEDQQRLIDKLVTLQKQYLQSLVSLFPQGGQPTSDVKPPEPVGKIDPVKTDDPKPTVAKADPKPKVVAVKKDGAGTVVGKIAGAADAIVYVDTISATTKTHL